MRWFLGFVLACWPMFAAANECSIGSSEAIQLIGWNATHAPRGDLERYIVSLEFRSDLDTPTRMIEGFVKFEDVLGRPILMYPIDEDTHSKPHTVFTQENLYFPEAHGDRLITVNHEDIVGIVCVEAIVTEDGKVVTFG